MDSMFSQFHNSGHMPGQDGLPHHFMADMGDLSGAPGFPPGAPLFGSTMAAAADKPTAAQAAAEREARAPPRPAAPAAMTPKRKRLV